MKIISMSFVALCAAAALPSAVTATTINFDVDGFGAAIAANTPITNQYSNLGVTFVGIENSVLVNVNAAPDPDSVPAPSAPNVMTNCADANLGCPGNRADLVRMLFSAPVSGISFQLDTLGSEAVTFNLYDSFDNLLETMSVSSGGSLYIPVSFTASGVSRLDGLQPSEDWAWAFDDLTFTAGAVPEPASWAMMIAGFAIIGASMRGRRRATLHLAH